MSAHRPELLVLTVPDTRRKILAVRCAGCGTMHSKELVPGQDDPSRVESFLRRMFDFHAHPDCDETVRLNAVRGVLES